MQTNHYENLVTINQHNNNKRATKARQKKRNRDSKIASVRTMRRQFDNCHYKDSTPISLSLRQRLDIADMT